MAGFDEWAHGDAQESVQQREGTWRRAEKRLEAITRVWDRFQADMATMLPHLRSGFENDMLTEHELRFSYTASTDTFQRHKDGLFGGAEEARWGTTEIERRATRPPIRAWHVLPDLWLDDNGSLWGQDTVQFSSNIYRYNPAAQYSTDRVQNLDPTGSTMFQIDAEALSRLVHGRLLPIVFMNGERWDESGSWFVGGVFISLRRDVGHGEFGAGCGFRTGVSAAGYPREDLAVTYPSSEPSIPEPARERAFRALRDAMAAGWGRLT